MYIPYICIYVCRIYIYICGEYRYADLLIASLCIHAVLRAWVCRLADPSSSQKREHLPRRPKRWPGRGMGLGREAGDRYSLITPASGY